MRITNVHNLPDTFVNVIKRPQYSKGASQISATEILNSPRIVQLKNKHWDELTQDASEMVWSIFGSAVHGILEHGKDNHHIVEERLHIEFNGWHISGAIDLQEVEEDGIIISDYKVTGAWSVMNTKADWENQLNIYAWLVNKVKGVNVKKLQICAIIRDWSAREATTRENYPQAPVVIIDIPIWDFQYAEQYVARRLSAHNDAVFAIAANFDLPECTPEEMWEKPTMYAVMKEGGKRAKSVHKTLAEAEAQLTKGYAIEVRPGGRTRCEGYCQAAPFCDQWKRYQEQQHG